MSRRLPSIATCRPHFWWSRLNVRLHPIANSTRKATTAVAVHPCLPARILACA